MSKEMIELENVIDRAWSDLVEKDDRTSPEEYPDMALITADELREFMERVAALRASAVAEPTFQKRVHGWMMDCFSMEICRDRQERNHRFLEEALELVQACDGTASEAHQLVDYVFGRDKGSANQELGGVMVTLAALCLANDIDMHHGGEIELARILQPDVMHKIRAKQAAKPKHSPLPAHPAPAAPVPASVREALKDIDSWRGDTLGKRPHEDTEYRNAAIDEAFDRGVRMAFYRCSDRARIALASLPAPAATPSDIERAFQDACDEAGCAYDNEALLEAISALKQAAAPTPEEIAKKLMEFDDLQTWELTDRERARYLRHADAILALKAAPAKASHVALGSDMDDGQRGRDRE